MAFDHLEWVRFAKRRPAPISRIMNVSKPNAFISSQGSQNQQIGIGFVLPKVRCYTTISSIIMRKAERAAGINIGIALLRLDNARRSYRSSRVSSPTLSTRTAASLASPSRGSGRITGLIVARSINVILFCSTRSRNRFMSRTQGDCISKQGQEPGEVGFVPTGSLELAPE